MVNQKYLEKHHIYNLIQEFQEKYQETFDIKDIDKGLAKKIKINQTGKQDLESLKRQIKDMCICDPTNKIGNFI